MDQYMSGMKLKQDSKYSSPMFSRSLMLDQIKIKNCGIIDISDVSDSQISQISQNDDSLKL